MNDKLANALGHLVGRVQQIHEELGGFFTDERDNLLNLPWTYALMEEFAHTPERISIWHQGQRLRPAYHFARQRELGTIRVRRAPLVQEVYGMFDAIKYDYRLAEHLHGHDVTWNL